MTELTLELPAYLGQLGELGVVQDASPTLFGGERVLTHPAGRICAHGHLLDGDTRHVDDAIPAHHVMVRCGAACDDGFTEAPHRFDHHLVGPAADRVDGAHDA